MEESVKINISANDTASMKLAEVSKKFKQARQDAELAKREFQQLGRNTADASDGVQKLANAMGGGWLASAALQVKDLTEGVWKLKGALDNVPMTAKVGIGAVTALAAVKIGSTIGDWAFETERWKNELEKAREALAGLKSQMSAVERQRHNDRMAEIELEAQRGKGAKAFLEYQQELKNEAKGLDAAMKRQSQTVASMEAEFLGFHSKNHKANIENIKAQIAADKEKRKELTATIIELGKLAGESEQKHKDEVDKKFFNARMKRLKDEAKARMDNAKQELALREENQKRAVEKQAEIMNALKSDLKEAESIRISAPSDNQAAESRLLTGVSAGFKSEDMQLQALEKAAKIQEAQRKINAQSLEILKTIGNKLGITQIIMG